MPLTIVREEGRRTRRTLWRVGLVIVMSTLVVGWEGDHRSCERQLDVRQSLIDNRQINRDAIPYWKHHGMPAVAARLRQRVDADATIHIPNCDGLLPGT